MASIAKKPQSEKKRAQDKKNLHPIKKGGITKEEAKRRGRKGGRKSGKARKEVADLRTAMQNIMKLPLTSGAISDPKSIQETSGMNMTVTNAIAAAMAIKAMNGDPKAVQLLQEANGTVAEQAELEIRRKEYELKAAELKIKQEQHDAEMAEINRRNEQLNDNSYKGIPALGIAPAFLGPLFDIEDHNHLEYVFQGGRGSTKSSFISLTLIDLLMKNENINALVMRKVSNTLNGSVYNQLVWAIDYLGLTNEFHCTRNPAEIRRISNKQTIFFRGADDPAKVKSLKPIKGYIGIVWFEELDQFSGEEEIRKLEQSAMRGGDMAWIFKSFNPPKSALNWANKYIKIPKETRLVHTSDYLSVPRAWLGTDWINEAEFLKETNPTAYENEYLGVANGTGGNVFDNVDIREITNDEIAQFDRIMNGLDWGWYPDPFDFVRCHYDAARLTLYVYSEYRCNKKSNRETADVLIKDYGLGEEIVTCDSAEHKSTQDYRTYGISARDAEKGPGSVEYSMKWLASLKAIIIDPVKCPYAADEFINYEYERDKEGNVITGYPDKNNHSIDAVRYATNPIWRKRGQ